MYHIIKCKYKKSKKIKEDDWFKLIIIGIDTVLDII